MRRIRESEWTPDMYLRVHAVGEQIGVIFPPLDPQQKIPLDAILIPGGGVQKDGNVLPWVRARLDAARGLEHLARYVITLSRGTAHKPPVIVNGIPVHEADAGKKYLIEQGVTPEKIRAETESLDTLGNAFYSRTMHTDPLELRNLLIINSAALMILKTFHTFYWVFNLPPQNGYNLHILITPNVGLTQEALDARLSKEIGSRRRFAGLMNRIKTLSELGEYMLSDEYKTGAKTGKLGVKELESY